MTSDQLENADVLAKVLGKDIEKIRRTLEETSRTDFEQAVDSICAARSIYIIGVRSAAALAQFMSCLLYTSRPIGVGEWVSHLNIESLQRDYNSELDEKREG